LEIDGLQNIVIKIHWMLKIYKYVINFSIFKVNFLKNEALIEKISFYILYLFLNKIMFDCVITEDVCECFDLYISN